MKYEDRIQRSIDYIDANLAGPLDLAEIASQSGYSLSHFYRVFPAITGFSVKEFVRNKRLALSARRLVTTGDRILDIAVECGFESQEVFTRAFSALYGCTPGEYRKNRKNSIDVFDRMDEFARQMELRGQHQPLEIPVKAEVIFRDRMHLAGMEMHTGVAQNIENLTIPEFWEKVFTPRLHEIENKSSIDTISAYEVSDPVTDNLLHMPCVQVTKPEAPRGMKVRSLEPGYYAAFTPQRPLDPYEYSALVRYAYGEWFPMSGCEIRADYSLDIYIHRLDQNGQPYLHQLTVLVPIFPPNK
jgi:AraC family transcriptional regulator